ncbi:MAG: tyrosine-type recombinase/integrase [Candidatus Acidiferrum sp.]
MRLRGTGSIFRKQGTRFWQISYYDSNGVQVQESSKSEKKSVAEALLRDRLAKADAGLPVESAKKLRYEDMRKSLLADMANKGNRGLKKYKHGLPGGLQHIDEFFKGKTARSITTDLINEFIRDKQDDGYANGMINRTLALLKRAMNIAKRDGKLASVPYFPHLDESEAVRQGFVEADRFKEIRKALPEHLHPLLIFLHTTGIRVSAARAIKWRQIEESAEKMYVRLPGILTKNKQPLLLPLATELAALLRGAKREGAVFNGTNLRREWDKVRIAVGDSDLLIHDLRRTGARNLRRAGVPESVIMAIGGWRTRSVFLRYNIVDTSDLDDAMAKLEAKNGQ